jgi:hypothetical protein
VGEWWDLTTSKAHTKINNHLTVIKDFLPTRRRPAVLSGQLVHTADKVRCELFEPYTGIARTRCAERRTVVKIEASPWTLRRWRWWASRGEPHRFHERSDLCAAVEALHSDLRVIARMVSLSMTHEDTQCVRIWTSPVPRLLQNA